MSGPPNAGGVYGVSANLQKQDRLRQILHVSDIQYHWLMRETGIDELEGSRPELEYTTNPA